VHHDGIQIDDEQVLHTIAERIPTNVRTLEGALIRVVAFASLTGQPVTGTLAGEVLDGLYPAARPPHRISIAGIQDIICEAFAITRDDLLSESRAARVAWPRQVAMYLAREHTDETLPSIGALFGGRNHTTVMHAVKRTAEKLATDPDVYETVRSLTERLQRRDPDRRD
jgi:chromosomal replication initiator protein